MCRQKQSDFGDSASIQLRCLTGKTVIRSVVGSVVRSLVRSVVRSVVGSAAGSAAGSVIASRGNDELT